MILFLKTFWGSGILEIVIFQYRDVINSFLKFLSLCNYKYELKEKGTMSLVNFDVKSSISFVRSENTLNRLYALFKIPTLAGSISG